MCDSRTSARAQLAAAVWLKSVLFYTEQMPGRAVACFLNDGSVRRDNCRTLHVAEGELRHGVRFGAPRCPLVQYQASEIRPTMVLGGGSYAEHSELVRPPLLFIANDIHCPNALQLRSAGAFRVVIRAHCAIALLGCSVGSGGARARLSKASCTYTNVQAGLP